MFRKYHAKKVTIDGHKFDSIKEANRYLELKQLEDAGIISDLELQPRFVLQEAFRCDGNSYRKIEYIADFRYTQDEQVIVEDVKGMKTDVYKLKKKLFLKEYGGRVVFKEVF